MMPKEFKLKIILGGSAKCGKSTFINDISTNINETDASHIGISFKPIECIVNDNDFCNYIVWDLKAHERFRFLYPLFCRGASGALLCFDVSDIDSFKELPFWIQFFRNPELSAHGELPIVLVVTKTDLQHRVTNEEIQDFVEKNDLTAVFFTAINDRKSNKEELFRKLTEKLSYFAKIDRFSIVVPREDEHFTTFLRFFSHCPICKKENHFESLKSFYFSKSPKMVKLKDQLLDMLDYLSRVELSGKSNLAIGIPCCSCYKNYFNE